MSPSTSASFCSETCPSFAGRKRRCLTGTPGTSQDPSVALKPILAFVALSVFVTRRSRPQRRLLTRPEGVDPRGAWSSRSLRNASVKGRSGRRSHDCRAVTCHVQRIGISFARNDRPDLSAPWSDAEAGSRLRIEGRTTSPGNVEGDPPIGRRWRTEDFASGSTPFARIGQRVRPLTTDQLGRFTTMTTSALTPMLTVKDATAAIQFYGAAFGAVEVARFTTPTGQVVAELTIDGCGSGLSMKTPKRST